MNNGLLVDHVIGECELCKYNKQKTKINFGHFAKGEDAWTGVTEWVSQVDLSGVKTWTNNLAQKLKRVSDKEKDQLNEMNGDRSKSSVTPKLSNEGAFSIGSASDSEDEDNELNSSNTAELNSMFDEDFGNCILESQFNDKPLSDNNLEQSSKNKNPLLKNATDGVANWWGQMKKEVEKRKQQNSPPDSSTTPTTAAATTKTNNTVRTEASIAPNILSEMKSRPVINTGIASDWLKGLSSSATAQEKSPVSTKESKKTKGVKLPTPTAKKIGKWWKSVKATNEEGVEKVVKQSRDWLKRLESDTSNESTIHDIDFSFYTKKHISPEVTINDLDSQLSSLSKGDDFKLFGQSCLRCFNAIMEIANGDSEHSNLGVGLIISPTRLIVVTECETEIGQGSLLVEGNYHLHAFSRLGFKKKEKSKITVFLKASEDEESKELNFIIKESSEFIQIISTNVKEINKSNSESMDV